MTILRCILLLSGFFLGCLLGCYGIVPALLCPLFKLIKLGYIYPTVLRCVICCFDLLVCHLFRRDWRDSDFLLNIGLAILGNARLRNRILCVIDGAIFCDWRCLNRKAVIPRLERYVRGTFPP